MSHISAETNVKYKACCYFWMLPTSEIRFEVPNKNVCWKVPRLTGWWLTYPSEKYEFVSWDDEILNIWKNMEK